jgi:hypothetical protein
MTRRRLWPLRPQPMDHERIDQWLRRVAKAYGLTAPVFCRYGLGLPQGCIRILCTDPPDEVLAALEAGTGVPAARLRNMTESALLERSRRLLEEVRHQDLYLLNMSVLTEERNKHDR